MRTIKTILHAVVGYVALAAYVLSLALGGGVHLHNEILDDENFVRESGIVVHAHDDHDAFQLHVDEALLTQSGDTHHHTVVKVQLVASLPRTQNLLNSISHKIEMECFSSVSVPPQLKTGEQRYLHCADPPVHRGLTPDLEGRSPPKA